VTCEPREGYVRPITTYCTLAEYDLSQPHFFQAAIERIIAGEKIIAMRMSLYAFSDVSIANRMCKALSPDTHELSIMVQRDTGSESALGHLEKCARQLGVGRIAAFQGGMQVGGINSFHPKLVYIETPTRQIALIGSGNLSSGRKHTDYVYAVDVVRNDQAANGAKRALVTWVGCVTGHINDPSFDSTRNAVLLVRAACDSFDPAEASYLMPGDARQWLARSGFLLGRSDEFRIVSQGFNSADVNYLVRLAIRSGKKVRILLDDDMYWSSLYPDRDLMNEPYELNEYVLPLIRLGAQVRYVVTNHHDISRNFQHAKVYSFHAQNQGTAMVGSLNATGSALSDNLEVMTEIEGTGFQQYNAWFEDLWTRSIAHEEMPTADPLAKP
jgi:HKD family nuclease